MPMIMTHEVVNRLPHTEDGLTKLKKLVNYDGWSIKHVQTTKEITYYILEKKDKPFPSKRAKEIAGQMKMHSVPRILAKKQKIDSKSKKLKENLRIKRPEKESVGMKNYGE